MLSIGKTVLLFSLMLNIRKTVAALSLNAQYFEDLLLFTLMLCIRKTVAAFSLNAQYLETGVAVLSLQYLETGWKPVLLLFP